MGRKYSERREYRHDVDYMTRALEVAFMECGFAVLAPSSPPGSQKTGTVEVRSSRDFSAFSWGENIVAQLAGAPGGGSQVVVESKLKFGFVDWGRNKANVEQILNALDGRLS